MIYDSLRLMYLERKTFAYAVTNIFLVMIHILGNVEIALVCYRLLRVPCQTCGSQPSTIAMLGCAPLCSSSSHVVYKNLSLLNMPSLTGYQKWPLTILSFESTPIVWLRSCMLMNLINIYLNVISSWQSPMQTVENEMLIWIQ